MTKKKKGTDGQKNTWKIAAVGVAIVLVAAGLYNFGPLQGFGGGKKPLEFHKGIGYVSWASDGYLSESSDESLKALRDTGADWVSVLVTWYQNDCQSLEVKRMSEMTPSDESVVRAIRKAHELGMKVMFKLHVDLLNQSDGSWRGEIGSTNEPDWDTWFKSYTAYIMYYAEMAKREKVEMFCVGTELTTAATTKGYKWRDLIKEVRKKYKGYLTYAAHWDEYMDIRFWDLLDYVGINAYFPISKKMKPSYEQIKAGWSVWVAEMEEFQQKIQKPVIFPEAGCNSCDGALIRPWEHAPRREINLKIQEDDYKVITEIFMNKKWFYGMFWWYWGTNKDMGGPNNRGFVPQNKPAEQVIREAYSKDYARSK
jgi:hypothetical protein